MSSIRAVCREHPLALIVLGTLCLVIAFVNPLREAAIADDWAYAWTARHLLETGRYQLHDWAAPNLVFQAYWGALFMRMFGKTFSALRVSTLCLLALGLIAFYNLAREHGLDNTQAGLLMLAMLASPLVLHLGFTFNTDVPFLSCFIIALNLYTRAIRVRSHGLMLAGSIAACAAVLTRQFGVALIGGLALVWYLETDRRQRAAFLLCGLALPAMAGLYQAFVAILQPNWAARYVLLVQAQYFAHPGTVLANLVLGRPLVILEFLALFALPLVFLGACGLALGLLCRLSDGARKVTLRGLGLVGLAVSALMLLADHLTIGRPGFGSEQVATLAGGLSLSALCGWLLRSPHRLDNAVAEAPSKTAPRDRLLVTGLFALHVVIAILYRRFVSRESALMPYTGWNLGVLEQMSTFARGALTLCTSLGAALFAGMIALRYGHAPSWASIPQQQRLLDLTTLCLFAQQLAYGYVADEHLLGLLPFTLIVVGRHLRPWLSRYRLANAVACLAVMVVSAMWTRGHLERTEAYWKGGQYGLSAGAQPREIHSVSTWFWYHRFNDYLSEVPEPTLESEDDLFFRWQEGQRATARFLVTESLDVTEGEHLRVAEEIPYQDMFFRQRHLYVMEREGLRADE